MKNRFFKTGISWIATAFSLCAVFCVGAVPSREAPRTLTLSAGETLRVVELDTGETLALTLPNGSLRTFTLLETSATVLYSNLKTPKRGQTNGGTIYEMTARLLVDGQPLTLRRYVGSQESFYEPVVVNGVRIWFDAVQDVDAFLNFNHGDCKPSKRARFAVQAADKRICPDEVFLWFDTQEDTLDIARAHGGDNPWMGAFMGADAHGGLDLNQRAGTLNYTPIAFDDQYLFESLANGDENNRWRGIRQWPEGDTWILQAHHLLAIFYPERTPIGAGLAFCTAAGVKYGAHEHAHYVFKVKPKDSTEEIQIDPWIIFWQAFKDRATRRGDVRADMMPLSPGKTGEPMRFFADRSRPGAGRDFLRCVWTFGDGAAAFGNESSHVFARPGVYPITLTVFDGAHASAFTQHVTINGETTELPSLILEAADEPAFRLRPSDSMDVYPARPVFLPHTLDFTARADAPPPRARELLVRNAGAGVLAMPAIRVEALSVDETPAGAAPWLSVTVAGEGDSPKLSVRVNASELPPALYRARVRVDVPGALNSPQSFDVAMLVPSHPALPPRSKRVQIPGEKIVDNESPGEFYATPYFWLSPRFFKQQEGYTGSFLTNGGRPRPGEYARFAPDLRAGPYALRLSKQTPFADDVRFTVRVRHADGVSEVAMQPARSLTIGTFTFADGTDGSVDILAEGSSGQVLVDAVIFKRVDP